MLAILNNSSQNRSIVSFCAGFLLLYAFLAYHLRQTCFRDPSSVFFRPEKARVLSYSNFRKSQATKFADQAALHQPVRWADDASTRTELCVAIGSVSRHGFTYLKQTLGSVLEGLDERERRQIYVVVFIAHSNQTEHEDYNAPWLLNMADRLPEYPNDPELQSLIVDLETANDYPAHARKQKIDFSVLLDECAKVNPSYVLTLEDDVIAMDGWYHRLLAALGTAASKSREMGRESFLYLRIFYDSRLMGWNAEEFPYYVSSASMIILGQLGLLAFTYWRFPAIRRHLPPIIILILCFVCTPMLLGLFFAAGRSCMLPPKPGVHLMQKYGCCGQGLVFPQREVVDHLLPLYRESNDNHAAVDTFLENYADHYNELRFAISPVLIQHVGGKSSHGAGDQRYGMLTDDMPFDYGFETNDPVKLEKEHELYIESIKHDI